MALRHRFLLARGRAARCHRSQANRTFGDIVEAAVKSTISVLLDSRGTLQSISLLACVLTLFLPLFRLIGGPLWLYGAPLWWLLLHFHRPFLLRHSHNCVGTFLGTHLWGVGLCQLGVVLSLALRSSHAVVLNVALHSLLEGVLSKGIESALILLPLLQQKQISASIARAADKLRAFYMGLLLAEG